MTRLHRAASRIRNFPMPFPAGSLAWLVLLLAFAPAPASASATNNVPSPRGTILLVVGAPGEPEYATNFLNQAAVWGETARRQGFRVIPIGTTPETNAAIDDRSALTGALAAEPRDTPAPLWLVLIGHGTFDGQEARFNLRGPDVTATELATWLNGIERPLVIINTASASAPFLLKLSRTNRIVITATRSGHQQNATRFGIAFTQATQDPESDLDVDGQSSLLELFLAASRRVAEEYRDDGRLQTEHALLDDNGDQLGTPADWYRGLQPIRQPKEGKTVDGRRAHQVHLVPSSAELQLAPEARARRDALELRLFELRDRKASMEAAEYLAQLEALLLELAVLYRDAEAATR